MRLLVWTERSVCLGPGGATAAKESTEPRGLFGRGRKSGRAAASRSGGGSGKGFAGLGTARAGVVGVGVGMRVGRCRRGIATDGPEDALRLTYSLGSHHDGSGHGTVLLLLLVVVVVVVGRKEAAANSRISLEELLAAVCVGGGRLWALWGLC